MYIYISFQCAYIQFFRHHCYRDLCFFNKKENMATATQRIVLPPPPLLPPTEYRVSLYAGDLHQDVTEYDLDVAFSMIGPLRSLRLCKDRSSGKSLCYAYINFCFPSHAAEALSRLNHTEMKGKPMRIMWCQTNPLVRKSGFANLFVKNLDSSVTAARLEEIFRKFGAILSCKVAEDDNGKSKGFGFVQFGSEESAKDALNALDGTILDRKIISVAKFLKRSERKEPKFTNLYVKNLDEDFTEVLLKDKFSEYGEVTSAVIMKDDEGKSKGFGFVNFESHDSAKKAIEALNGTMMGSKKWFVGKAMTKAEREGLLQRSHQREKPNPSNLFVRNLAMSVEERNLEEVFGAFGRVTSAKVIRCKNGVNKGLGNVRFSNPEEAKRARDILNGILYHGKPMYVSAQSEEEYARNQAHSASQSISNLNLLCTNQNLLPYYNASSFQPLPFYDVCWQPHMYGNVNASPAFKAQVRQQESSKGWVCSSDGPNKKQSMKPYTSEGAARSPLGKEFHQTGQGVKRSGLVWEMKRSDLQKVLNSEKSLKMQVEKAVQAKEASSWSGSFTIQAQSPHQLNC